MRRPARALSRLLFYARALGTGPLARLALRRLLSPLFGKKGPSWLPPRLTPEEAEAAVSRLSSRPLFSLILPGAAPEAPLVRETLSSLLAQNYPRWELLLLTGGCARAETPLSDPAGPPEQGLERVRVLPANGPLRGAEALNRAVHAASGELVALVEPGDLLHPSALLEAARLLQDRPEADLIYTDEDRLDPRGAHLDPVFKPDWSPERILGELYTGRLALYRRSLVLRIGAFRDGFGEPPEHDLVLRLTEESEKVLHIPRVLYHRRSRGAPRASEDAVQDALRRRRTEGRAEPLSSPGRLLVHLRPRGDPFVSILIPSRDAPGLLGPCLSSITAKTEGARYEILVIDNGSREDETFALYDRWKRRLGSGFRVISRPGPFNFSALVNRGAEEAEGDLLLLLNNDTELIGPPDWLSEMSGYAERPWIGCAGALLLYPDGTIQHAGIALGISPAPGALPAVAAHAFHRLAPERAFGFEPGIVTNTSAVTGACLMVRRALWEEAGGFDESLAVAYNDVDFCLRLSAQGLRHVILPHVRLLHRASATRGTDSPKRFLREARAVEERWAHVLRRDPFHRTVNG